MLWSVFEHDGYRFHYKTEISASTMKAARKEAAFLLGGEFLEYVPGRPKRLFKVSKVAS